MGVDDQVEVTHFATVKLSPPLPFSLCPYRGKVTSAVDKGKNRNALNLHAINESVPTNVDFSQVGLAELTDEPPTARKGPKRLTGFPYLRRKRGGVGRGNHEQGRMLSPRSRPPPHETRLRDDPLLESLLHFFFGQYPSLVDVLQTHPYLLENVEMILNILERGILGQAFDQVDYFLLW